MADIRKVNTRRTQRPGRQIQGAGSLEQLECYVHGEKPNQRGCVGKVYCPAAVGLESLENWEAQTLRQMDSTLEVDSEFCLELQESPRVVYEDTRDIIEEITGLAIEGVEVPYFFPPDARKKLEDLGMHLVTPDDLMAETVDSKGYDC